MPADAARAHLEVSGVLDPSHLAFDEGRAAFLLLLAGLVLASVLPSLLRRVISVRRLAGDGATQRSLDRSPVATGPRGAGERPAPPGTAPVAGPLGRSAEAAARTGGASAPGRPEASARGRAEAPEPLRTVRRCRSCYGKYDASRHDVCPYCAAADEARDDRVGSYPQVEHEEVRARTRFHDAEQLNSEGVEMLRNLRASFRLDDAVKLFARAIDLAPRNATYHSNRAVAHLTNASRRLAARGDPGDALFRRDVDAAREDVLSAIELRPAHANFHHLLGQVEELAADRDAARRAFEQALVVDAGHAGAREALERLGSSPGASTGIGAGHRETAQHLLAVAQELVREGDAEQALRTLEEAERADPAWPAPLFAHAELLDRMGRQEQSVELARRAVEVSSKDVEHLLETVRAHGQRLRSERGDDDAEELSLTGGASRAGGALNGSLAEVGLPDLVQVLGSSGKTVRISLARPGARGSIDLEDGSIVHAELGPTRGEEALYELVTWTEGEFRVDATARPSEHTLSGSNESLILEGLRRLDERGATAEVSDGED